MYEKHNLLRHPIKRLKRRWHIRYKHNKKHLLLDFIIGACVLILIAVNVFWIFGGFHYLIDKTEVEISMDKEEIGIGEQVEFKVEYFNGNKFDLEEFNIALLLPKNFEILDVSRENYDFDHNVLYVGRVKGGSKGELTVTGNVWADLGAEQLLVVNTNYYKTDKKGDRLWGQFQTPFSLKYKVEKSGLKLDFDAPEKAVNGQIADLVLNIKNNFNFKLNTFFVQPLVNGNFQIVSSDQPFQNQQWIFPQLYKGQVKQINIKARVLGKKKVYPAFNVLADINGNKIKVGYVSKAVELFETDFVSSLGFVKTEVIKPGADVDLQIDYNNKNGYSLEDVQFEIELLSDYWNLSASNLGVGDKQLDNKILISSDHISKLALIQPHETGQINLKLKTKTYLAQSIPGLSARLNVYYKVNELPVYVLGEKVNTALSTNLRTSATVRYFTDYGEQLGRGSLPPKVGKETKYWIFVHVLNDINEVENVQVSAELYNNVTWTGKSNVTVGNALDYNEAIKTVSWVISKVPKAPKNFGFAFEVGLMPSEVQRNKYAGLVKNIYITGKDVLTSKQVDYVVPALTTQLFADQIGALKGGKVK